ncbi:MAG TPA: winged helix-turn-helix domain-containing protein [Blastocatellia bacterium]|nr:winged helix-turn-helix domain-containing protein [Blastocatellia bacterium]
MGNNIKHFYEFDKFRLDPQEKLLLRTGERVPLTLKAFETLLILVERHGHMVEKAELMHRVWPDAAVEENNLNQNISVIRKALGETSHTQQFIETLPRRGYRFVAAVREITEEELPPARDLVTIPSARESLSTVTTVPTQRRLRFALFTLGPLLVLSGLSYWMTKKPSSSIPLPSNLKLNRVPATNDAWETALSPDGKLLAYIVGDAGQQSLYVKQLETGTDTELLAHEEGRFRGLAFSPDGKSIFYAQQEKATAKRVLYSQPVQGGEAKRLLVGVDSAVTFAPDGKQIAFIREALPGKSSLMVANADGSGERILAVHQSQHYYAVEGPSWSPDGRLIAVARGATRPKFHFQIVTVEVESGKETSVSEQKWEWATKIAWLPDQKGLVLIGRSEQERGHNDQLWRLDYPNGQAHRILPTLHSYRGVSLDSSGKNLVSIRSEMRSNIWVIPQDENAPPKMITSDAASQEGIDGLAWALDNRLVYTSIATGHKDLWVVQSDGTQAKPLTTDPQDNAEAPSITADGHYVVFNGGRSGIPHIWRIGLDGKAPLELTQGNLDLQPTASPLDAFVYFSQDIAGQRRVSRVSVNGNSPPQPLTDKITQYPAVSPDGKWIACLYQETAAAPPRIAILPAAGGAPTQLLEFPAFHPTSLRWHPDGRALTYLQRQDGAMNLWRQPLTGGAPQKITNFQTERIFAYAWSRDGRALACARGTVNRDIIMINDFR